MRTQLEVFGTRLATTAKAEKLPDGRVVVRDLPIFAETRPGDPAVAQGAREVRDRAWLEEALRRHNARLALDHQPITTLRHIFDNPERVGSYELTHIDKADVNPDEEPRWTVFGDIYYESVAAFEKAKDYDFRSPEISPDAPKEFGALALLRDKLPYNKFPGVRPELVEAFRARGGDAPQVWRRSESFGSSSQPRADDGKWTSGGSGGGSGSGKSESREKRPTDKLAAKHGLWKAAHKEGVSPGDYLAKHGLKTSDFYKSDLANRLSGETLDELESSEGESFETFEQSTKAHVGDDAAMSGSHETKEGAMPPVTAAPPAAGGVGAKPSIDDRMDKLEAMMAKCYEAITASKPSATPAAEKPADEHGEHAEGAHPEKPVDGLEKAVKKPEAAQSAGPNGSLPPAVSELRAGESFSLRDLAGAAPKPAANGSDGYASKLEVFSLRTAVEKLTKEKEAVGLVASAQRSLSDMGMSPALVEKLHGEFFEAAVSGGKPAVDSKLAFAKSIMGNLSRGPEVYGALAGTTVASGEPEDLKKAIEQFGQRPEKAAQIRELYAAYQTEMSPAFRRSTPFARAIEGMPQFNERILADRGGRS